MSVLDLISPEAIDERAQRIDYGAFWRAVGRFLLAFVTFVFAGLGWLVGSAIYATTWVAAAVAEGYSAGRHIGRHRQAGD